jgi:hypothetical protein
MFVTAAGLAILVAMKTATDAIARSIRSAAQITQMFASDLSPADMLHRPCEGANCAAWIVGHLIMAARSMGIRAGLQSAPQLPDGFDKTFARDEIAPKSADYGDVSILMPLFKTTHDWLAGGVELVDLAKLAQPLEKPSPMFATVGEMLAFAPVHIATHAGHLSTIRRSLGRAALV